MRAASGAMFAQAAFQLGQENAQHRALQSRVALNEVAQPLGHGEHPLAHRAANSREAARVWCVLLLTGQFQDGACQHPRPGRKVGGGGAFCFVVAHPVQARHEHHPRRAQAVQVHRVMAGA